MNAAGGQIYREEDEITDQAVEGGDLDGEVVGGRGP